MIIEKLDELVDLFIDGHCNIQQIKLVIDEYTNENNISIENLLNKYIEDGVQHKNSDRVEFFIILSDILMLHKHMINNYKKLLFEDWHDRHENIVDNLGHYGDASLIPLLIKCFELKYNHLKYNEFYSFHKHLIWAIKKLSIEDNKKILRSISKFVSPKLRSEL